MTPLVLSLSLHLPPLGDSAYTNIRLQLYIYYIHRFTQSTSIEWLNSHLSLDTPASTPPVVDLIAWLHGQLMLAIAATTSTPPTPTTHTIPTTTTMMILGTPVQSNIPVKSSAPSQIPNQIPSQMLTEAEAILDKVVLLARREALLLAPGSHLTGNLTGDLTGDLTAARGHDGGRAPRILQAFVHHQFWRAALVYAAPSNTSSSSTSSSSSSSSSDNSHGNSSSSIGVGSSNGSTGTSNCNYSTSSVPSKQPASLSFSATLFCQVKTLSLIPNQKYCPAIYHIPLYIISQIMSYPKYYQQTTTRVL